MEVLASGDENGLPMFTPIVRFYYIFHYIIKKSVGHIFRQLLRTVFALFALR